MGSPVPVPLPSAPQQSKAQSIMEILTRVLPQLGASMSPQAGAPPGGSPGRVGGAPPAMTAPPPGAPGVDPRAAAAQAPRAMPAPAQQGPAYLPQPQPGAMQTGFEFNSKAGAKAATVSGVISNMTQAISRARQKQEESQRTKAANYASQLAQAMADGDQETVQMMLSDPKIVKTIEKGLDYVFPKEPGEPPPPEAKGVIQGIQKALGRGKFNQQNRPMPAAGQPGGVHLPRPSMAAQTATMQQQAQQKELQFGPQQMAALQQRIGMADPEIQPAMKGMLEAAQMFPTHAPDMVKSMLQAQATFAGEKMQFGNKIALVNMQEQFRTSLEAAREQNRMMIEGLKQTSQDERLNKRLDFESDKFNKSIDFQMEKLQKMIDVKNSPKPLNAKQALAVTQTKDISKRVIESLDEALKPENLKVIDSTLSSLKARGLTSFAGRFVPGSDAEKTIAKIFTRLKEQSNALRGPYGATGFRSREALTALWNMVAADKWWYQDPAVTKQVLQDARTDHQLLIDDAEDALAIGKPKEPEGESKTTTGGVEIIRDAQGRITGVK